MQMKITSASFVSASPEYFSGKAGEPPSHNSLSPKHPFRHFSNPPTGGETPPYSLQLGPQNPPPPRARLTSETTFDASFNL